MRTEVALLQHVSNRPQDLRIAAQKDAFDSV